MPRVMYGILCHQSVNFVSEQFRLLFDRSAQFVYHVDRKASAELHDFVAGLAASYNNVSVIPSSFCSWGGFSLTRAMLSIIRVAVGRPSWDHLIFLSEQHLPLQSYSTIAKALNVRCNYMEIRNFRSLLIAGQENVRGRFAQNYVELAGVGSFGTTTRALPEEFFDRLFHGSQWITLCRTACELLACKLDRRLQSEFATSIMSDENAIQTWVAELDAEGAIETVCRSLTFIALPALGGSEDATFNHATFFAAQEAGHLFIRKRPLVLPPSVVYYYDETTPRSKRPAVTLLRDAQPELGFRLATESVAHCLNASLARLGGLALVPMRPGVQGPSFFYQTRLTSTDRPPAIYVLSQDLSSFKVVAVLHEKPSNFEDATIGKYRTSVLRVRAHDIASYQEVHLAGERGNGFYNVEQFSDLDGLAELIEFYAQRMSELPSS